MPPSPAPCVRPAEVVPLTADQRRLHATVSAEFARKLTQAQDHIEPRALGGKSTVDDLRILCRPHNIEAARRIFGDAVMDRYTRKPRRRTDARPRPRRATAPPAG